MTYQSHVFYDNYDNNVNNQVPGPYYCILPNTTLPHIPAIRQPPLLCQ